MADQPEKSESTEQQKRSSRLGCSVILVLCFSLYILSEPWLLFGLYNLSPTLPDRIKPLYVVVYAPNHILAKHSETYRESYQQYCDALERRFPEFFDWTSFRNRP